MAEQDLSNHLIIFDLDGTLIDVFEEHAASLEETVAEVWGIPILLAEDKPYGIPQKQTLRNAAEAANLDEDQINANLPLAMVKISEKIAHLLPEDLSGRCLPGARELLEKYESMENVHLVLATGTLGRTANMLLERCGLLKFFPVGAYGHECSTREELVALARDRGLDFYKLDKDQARVVTIGDSPADIIAGKAIGAFAIGVATSLFSQEALNQFKPDALLKDLNDTRSVVVTMLMMEG